MKTKTYKIPVRPDRISFLSDPTGQGHDTIYAYVKIADLPLDLPTDVNPRAQNTESRVARQIQNGLMTDASVFHLLNRGMTVTAFDASYDKRSEKLSLELAGSYYGLLDGGHTYAVINKNLKPYLESLTHPKPVEENGDEQEVIERPEFMDNGYIRLEVIVGVKSDLLVDIARSRNTSAQVKDESLANLEGSFDWLKDVLAKTPYGHEIAYKENEDDTQFPIDVREIVSLLTLFHPNFMESEKPPIMAYTSKGRCLELFRDAPEGFQSLSAIIPDILKLYDYVHLKFADVYQRIGGFTGLEDEKQKKTKGVKLAKVSGVKAIREGFPLYYIRDKAFYLFPDGWLFPVVSSLRAIVSYRAHAKWKANPFKFFDSTAKNLVKMTLETSTSLGRNPNAVGKSKAHWIQLFAHEQSKYISLLNVDTEKEVPV